MNTIWGCLAVFCLLPILGGLPLVDGLVRLGTGQSLRNLGTGNISVSAAFYHAGTVIGILAVLSEAAKGLAAVGIARYFFPSEPVWELVALITLVMGRYWLGKGAGITNVFWGLVWHDFMVAVAILVMGGVSLTLFRERRTGRLVGLGVMVVLLALHRFEDANYGVMALILGSVLAWILQTIPDDLDLPTPTTTSGLRSRAMFRFFRSDQGLLSLGEPLDAQKVGNKAATLSQLKQWGYSVPDGWVLLAGDDLSAALRSVTPTPERPLIVRSSAIGEDGLTASAAGQYLSVGDVTSTAELEAAIVRCQQAYHRPQAAQYRERYGQPDRPLAVIIQTQVASQYAGVAFSRDPLEQYRQGVTIEAIAGTPGQVVGGQITPERYAVYNPDAETSTLEGEGVVPPDILYAVARLARELEGRYHGIPQDIEWCHDGETLWLLQARPITTLTPIWSRKIAAEVIPGVIRPLTWSINQPLTCGVWGELFTMVLGERRSQGLDFAATATLHFSHAYFNASLISQIFQQMGLPPESLEWLTRGAKLSRPSVGSTLRNLPGLLALLKQEWRLPQQFAQDERRWFEPLLNELAAPIDSLSEPELAMRIERILLNLRRVTAYQILAPLSVALRQAILKVTDAELDTHVLPEVAALRSLLELAEKSRNLLPLPELEFDSCPSLFAYLAETPDGGCILDRFNQWLGTYGYLSEVATDIAVPRWLDDPRPMRELFSQCIFSDGQRAQLWQTVEHHEIPTSWAARWLQPRLVLKGRIAEIYNRFLAHLRWTFRHLESRWQEAGYLPTSGDIFFLTWPEISDRLAAHDPDLPQPWPVEAIASIQAQIDQRRQRYAKDVDLVSVPPVVYGQPQGDAPILPTLEKAQTLRGIAVSPGVIEGVIQPLQSLQTIPPLTADTILVVPYTDAGWSPLLVQVGGIIAEAGGRLSHGAIVAREYGIPAVFDVAGALGYLRAGQRVRLDGDRGVVEVLAE
ncbi:MAG: pyruvate phosphate dikinase PEP/pyruvate-binding protein [Spirulina sp. SIO3F2]|nr:pyruvate phosphate dikinase PEP/pyruvate-binding protein [Spirulina sp. SIO3F2]